MKVKQEDRSSTASGEIPPAAEVKFGVGDEFHHELRQRVERYFESTGRRQRDCPQMYLKTALIFSWFVASYVLLVFVVETWWLAVPLALSLGLSMAAIGFNIMHDGGHRAYSDRPWINKLMALSLDLLGGSSYVWARQHNSLHHSYANIAGHDNDIDLGFLGRLAPHQKRLKIHRLQHYYLWPLYGWLMIKWQFFDDFHNVIAGRIGGHRLARPKGWALATFLGGKAVYFSLAFELPLFVQGLTASVVFQMAHCVEEAAFPLPRPETGRMETSWAVHQVETTVDFARGSRLVSWFLGGLNFQIEHHLFPQICHVHYPALAPLVEATCKEYGLRYAANDTFLASVASHFRWLRRMGMASSA
jgi:linoleoyl-CoA desaturase